jgi:hypothetical protein
MEMLGIGSIWKDSHYLPFLFPFGYFYFLPIGQIRWINIPSQVSGTWYFLPILQKIVARNKFWNGIALHGKCLNG